jgi:crotonyl-CoA carboxylase/reductase
MVIRRHGGPEVVGVEDLPVPDPGPGEARVRVRASGVNANEYWLREGIKTFELPAIPGSDAAGTVDAVGPGVSDVRPGDPVLVYCGVACGQCARCRSGQEHLCEGNGGFRIWGFDSGPLEGAHAEYACLPVRQLVAKPRGLTWEEAASLPLVLVTAWHMLIANARVHPNQTVLVRGASGGMGAMGLQIARMLGAETISVVSNEEKARFVEKVGTDYVVIRPRQHESAVGRTNGGSGENGHAIDDNPQFRRRIRDLTGGRGVDIVFDTVGGPTLMESLKMLRPGGVMVTCGSTDGYVSQIDMPYLFIQNKSIVGSTLGTRTELVDALRAVERGSVHPCVTRLFPLERCAEAADLLRSGRALGKVVVTR